MALKRRIKMHKSGPVGLDAMMPGLIGHTGKRPSHNPMAAYTIPPTPMALQAVMALETSSKSLTLPLTTATCPAPLALSREIKALGLGPETQSLRRRVP